MQTKDLKEKLPELLTQLRWDEFAENTIKSYQKDILGLFDFLHQRDVGSIKTPDQHSNAELTKDDFLAYKKSLEAHLKPASVNRHIASVNKFLKFAGLDGFVLKILKIQEQTTVENELSPRDFEKLVNKAFELGRVKIALIMLTLAGTGLRIGELKFVTAEAARRGRVEVKHKGKIRAVVIPKDVQNLLISYSHDNKIKSGVMFVGYSGKPITRTCVALQMKDLACKCNVDTTRVFPHNLRHYFARRFLECCSQISDLADALGHHCIETTRRYLRTSFEAKQKILTKLKILPFRQDFSSLRYSICAGT